MTPAQKRPTAATKHESTRKRAAAPVPVARDVVRVPGYAEPFRRVRVDAVLADARTEAGPALGQEQFAEAFEVTARTVRDWHKRGLPVELGPGGAPRYGPRAMHWGVRFSQLARLNRAPRHLDSAEVERWWLAEQVHERPQDYVAVPLSWSDPRRRALLARACAGKRPAPLDDDDAPDLGDDAADDEAPDDAGDDA